MIAAQGMMVKFCPAGAHNPGWIAAGEFANMGYNLAARGRRDARFIVCASRRYDLRLCRDALGVCRGSSQAGCGSASRLLAAQAALERAKLQLSYTDIRAPMTGRIGRAPISVGNFVGPPAARSRPS